jgi:hypothetical protein
MSEPEREPEPVARAALGADLIIPVLACGLAAYYFGSTVELVWEAKATGIFIGVILVALCVVQFVRVGRQVVAGTGSLGLGDLVAQTEFNKQRFGLLALVAVFVITLPWVGTTLGLFLLLVAGMWLLGVRSVRALIGVAAVTAATVHLLLITLLNSRLPQGVVQTLLAALSGGA